MTVIEHAEKYLGNIDQGWKDNDSNENLQIVSFVDCPGESATTFMSLGLSDNVLEISDEKQVRQELVFSVYSMAISTMIVSFLFSLCESIVNRGKAVLRGEIIPLSIDVAKRIGFEAVYCAIPVFFDDDFAEYDESTPPTIVVWVLPIYQSEADYIRAHGWEKFEGLLEERDPDLCSLERVPVI
jgi:hypothetical protein